MKIPLLNPPRPAPKPAPKPALKPAPKSAPVSTTKQTGDVAEDLALHHLQRRGLRLLCRNYRTPGRGGGEIDLIMAAPDGTLVFVEVRARATRQHGGAGGSIGYVKQQRIIYAAHQYLSTLRRMPPCRFDVVLVEPDNIEWLQAVFDAS